MFRKLLKHDMRSMSRLWLILSATALGLAVMAGLCFRGLTMVGDEVGMIAFIPFTTMGIFLSIFGIVAYVSAILIIIMVRFYKNFFSDEGYLTFTLPVKRSTLFNSKLVNAFIFNTGTLIVFLICIVVILAICPGVNGSTALGTVLEDLRLSFVGVGEAIPPDVIAWLITFALLAFLLIVAMYVFSTLLMFCCIIFGSIMVKKLKLLMAIGLYYAVNLAIEVLTLILSTLMSFTVNAFASAPGMITEAEAPWMLLVILIGIITAVLIVCCFLYKFALSKLRGNLNLA